VDEMRAFCGYCQGLNVSLTWQVLSSLSTIERFMPGLVSGESAVTRAREPESRSPKLVNCKKPPFRRFI